jgi:hypothetical protein
MTQMDVEAAVPAAFLSHEGHDYREWPTSEF